MTEDCHILGSGPSILKLTPDERARLSASPRVLAMNKFFLFRDLAGVSPRNLFLLDSHFPSPKVVLETVAQARGCDPPPVFWLSGYYRRLFSPARHPVWNLRERAKLRREHAWSPPLSLAYPAARFFEAETRERLGFRWARSLDEPLLFSRGSLTTAINLAAVLWPGRDIKLVGIDLVGAAPFYDEAYRARPDLQDDAYRGSLATGEHPTMTPNVHGTVVRYFPRIREELARDGARLLSCSPDGALVRDGHCDPAPV